MMAEVLFSSAIGEAEYDDLLEELTITFKDGSQYTYESVPQDVFSSFMAAASAGQYFNANIRNEYAFK